MTALNENGHLQLGAQSLEYRLVGPQPADHRTLILLHEGLGCVGLWGSFPEALAAATGLSVFAYSRAGYGNSSSIPLPRPLSYMHDEARETLPRLLDAIGFRNGMVLGHSDGASIAAIHAGAIADPRVKGICLMAPHFVVEGFSVAEIAKAREAYVGGGLREKLARWHTDVDAAFYGWNGAWLDPQFAHWDLREFLPQIRVPVQLIQGEADAYGTMLQVELAQSLCAGPVETVLLPGIGHSPYREAPQLTLEAVVAFASRHLKK